MKKKILQEHDLKKATPITTTETATLFKLNNGNIMKIYHPGIVEVQKLIDIDVEAKILSAQPLKNSPEILVPTSAVYTKNGVFCGYTMPCANGIDYNAFEDRMTIDDREDLRRYSEIHYKLESVLRRNPNIVFPDFCTCDNIFIDSKDNIQFIDYDGLQIGKHKSISVSTSLGTSTALICNPKYFTKDQYFTKELDKKSSIILYYLATFNVDLNKVGVYNPFTGRHLTLEDVFACLNLDDPDLCHKTYKLFNDKESNEFLGKDILNLAEKYDLKVVDIRNNMYIKRLVKKK